MNTNTRSQIHWIPVVGALGFSIATTTLALHYRSSFGQLGEWSYLGAFLTQAINSATIVIPAIGQAFIVGAASTMNPWWLGLSGGLGAAVGELVGYAVGVGGHHSGIKRHRHYKTIQSFSERWGPLAIFLFGATPLPFDFIGIWAGSVRYPIWRFFFFAAAGKIIQITALALTSLYGLAWIESKIN